MRQFEPARPPRLTARALDGIVVAMTGGGQRTRGSATYRPPRARAEDSVEASVDDAPASVSIISSQELRAMGYPTIAEAVRGIRGIYLSDDRS